MNSDEFRGHVASKLFPGQKVTFRSHKHTSMSEEENKDQAVPAEDAAVESEAESESETE